MSEWQHRASSMCDSGTPDRRRIQSRPDQHPTTPYRPPPAPSGPALGGRGTMRGTRREGLRPRGTLTVSA